MSNHPNRKAGRTGIPPSSPSPEQIREIRLSASLTQTEAGRLVYAALRTWQEWEGDGRVMPAAAWALFLIRARHRCALPKDLAEFVEGVLAG